MNKTTEDTESTEAAALQKTGFICGGAISVLSVSSVVEKFFFRWDNV